MSAAAPDILVHRGLDRGLLGTIVVSAAFHAAAVGVLIALPGQLISAPRKMESYTVDLVAPDVIGGTNLVPGGGKAKAPASKPGPPPDVAIKPPEPVAAKPAAQAAVEPPPPAPPKAAAPEPPKAAEHAPPAEPPKPPVEVPKPAEPPKPVVAKALEAKPVAPPKPPPPVEAKPPAAPKAAAQPAVAAKPASPAPPAPKKPAEAPKSQPAVKSLDEQIAAAVQRRAAQAQSGSAGANPDLDKQIAAAVQRRAQQVGAGAGSGTPAPGGPVSLGPASGAGGTPAGIEYILYQGKMEQRIKAAWAWASADKSRQAVIQFNLTPEGQVKNVRTLESSGDTQYDASCERAVRAVNPLDPVPEQYRKDFATVEMTFKPSDLEK